MKHHPVLLGSYQLTAGSEEGSELAVRGRLEKELREEGRVDHDQLTLEDGEMNNHPPGGNELAKRETQAEEDKLLEPANLVRRKFCQSKVPTENIFKNSRIK